MDFSRGEGVVFVAMSTFAAIWWIFWRRCGPRSPDCRWLAVAMASMRFLLCLELLNIAMQAAQRVVLPGCFEDVMACSMQLGHGTWFGGRGIMR